MTAIRRRQVASSLILLMIIATIFNDLLSITLPFSLLHLAGFAAWSAAILLFVDTRISLKIQVTLILGIGLLLISYVSRQNAGINLDFNFFLSSSTGLLTMIASVGFLRLVVIPENQPAVALPTGRKAFLQTILGLNIASSVINVSAPILIADRIHQRFSAQTLTRVFCGVSSWSPFFGAMAVVLTYVNEASMGWIMAAGFPFMLIGLAGVVAEAKLRYRDEVESFVGYPMQLRALRVPALLVAAVLALASLSDRISILVLIALSALLVTAAVLFSRKGLIAAALELRKHSLDRLSSMVNELCLFLAAGVLAGGISALMSQGALANPFDRFDGSTASIVLAIIVACGFIGIHPIVMISSFAPMIMTLEPNPNLVAVTFLFGWHLGTCSNPLSGTNLVFQGRYNISSWRIALWNAPYAILMTLVGSAWLALLAKYLPNVA